MKTCLLLLLLFLLPVPAFPEQDKAPVQAFVGATIVPIAGAPIERGVLLVQSGKVLAVGDRNLPIPAGAFVTDLTGKTVLPGLVDTHSHIAGPGGADSSAPIQPDVRVYDSLNMRESAVKKALAGGITTVNIMPGSGHLLSGQTVYLKLRGGRTVEDYFIRDSDGKPAGGLKMANGTNPIGDPPFPGTRAKSAAMVREQFIKAMEYRKKRQDAGTDSKKMPARDLGMEVLLEVLDGKRIVQHHTHRADDIMTVLRLQKEFGFKVVLHHVSEGWKVADEIARANVPCSIILIDAPGGKLEAVDLSFETGKVLEKAGVVVAYHTDDGITDSRLFLRSAALGVRAGMSREGALQSLTLAGAKMLGLEKQVGTLEPGKDADFVVLSGDPFSVYTKVLETWIEGRKVFDRTDPKDALYAVGGVGAGEEVRPYLCCIDEMEAKR
ncbi:MAG: amidohydrolase family protein [Armatimonadaceae bacterium]